MTNFEKEIPFGKIIASIITSTQTSLLKKIIFFQCKKRKEKKKVYSIILSFSSKLINDFKN